MVRGGAGMTVGDLLEELAGYDEDDEVQLLTGSTDTPNGWRPYRSAIRRLITSDEIAMAESEEQKTTWAKARGTVVYIVEGTQLGYGSKAAWDR